ncbi:MAG TPA: hypothetical protein VHG51_02835 [Longimicrobiaceae bacterium]|nr:hypothetical protein [Longimicrobiaceae bacterium]
MIAKATPPPRPLHTPGTPSLVGNKVPLPHRFHLTDGRTIDGQLHKSPNARLADHLSTLKGFISVTDARCEASGRHFPYLLLNQDHVLFVEEVVAPSTLAGGARDVQR